MDQTTSREDIERVVRKLGFVFSYGGTNCLVDSVLICVQDPEALTAVTKLVYPAVAKRRGIKKWRNVERNMRTAVEAFWVRGNRDFLNEMAGFPLRVQPSVGEIINYIVGYILDQ